MRQGPTQEREAMGYIDLLVERITADPGLANRLRVPC